MLIYDLQREVINDMLRVGCANAIEYRRHCLKTKYQKWEQKYNVKLKLVEITFVNHISDPIAY